MLGNGHAVPDEFWYHPENLPDMVFLYVKQFIADSLDTSATVLRCYIQLRERMIITRKYLVTFQPNRTEHIQKFRPFGVLEFSDKANENDKTFLSSMIRIEVHFSFWIELMIHKFDMDHPSLDGCRKISLCIETLGYRVALCGKRQPWNQVRLHNIHYLKHT